MTLTNFSSSSSKAYEGCKKDEQQQHNSNGTMKRDIGNLLQLLKIRVLKRLGILKTIRE